MRMRFVAGMAIVAAVFGILTSCGDSEKRNRIPLLADIEGLSSVKSGDDMSDYYTSDTVRAARRYSATHNGTDILAGMDRKMFAKGSLMHAISEKRIGDHAEIVVQIDKHPAVNMIGLRVRIPLSYERGRWKIDRSDMIRE